MTIIPGSKTTSTVCLFAVSLAIACALRIPSFFWSVINWDESIYLLISRDMIDGDVLYTGIWDRKQPLTFGFFAMAQWVFGANVLAMRFLGCFAVAATTVGLYVIGRRTFGDTRLGPTAAACLYAIFSVSSGGLATNTEILFAPFVVAAVALVLPWWVEGKSAARPSSGACFAAGLLIGLATLTKVIAVYDGVFVGLLLIGGWLISRRDADRPLTSGWLVRRTGLMVAGILLPWVLGTIYFWLVGALDEFIFANFTFNRMNLADRPPFSIINIGLVIGRLIMTQNGLLWLSLAVGAVVLVVRPGWLSRPDRRLLAALALWAVVGTLAAISLRRLYLHYYLQPTPALSLIGGFLFARFWTLTPKVPVLLKVAISVGLLIPQGGRIAERWRQIGTMTDTPAVVAAYLGDRVQAGDHIFVANYQPIIYVLTETRSPTRWAFPQFLISPVFRERLNIDLEDEMESIFQKAPEFVVFDTDPGGLTDPDYNRVLIGDHLEPNYELEARISTVAIFRRSSPGGENLPESTPEGDPGSSIED